MAIQIQLRRGTSSQWVSANPILASGEKGIETDTGKEKTGDGVTPWTALPYFGGSGGTSTHPDLAGHDALGLATQAELDAHGHPHDHPAPTSMVSHDGTPAVGDWLRVKSVNPLVVERAAAPSGGGGTHPYPIGRYIQIHPDGNTVTTLTKNREYAFPFINGEAMRIDQLGVMFWSAGDGAAIVRFAIRADNKGNPGPVLVQASVGATTADGAGGNVWKYVLVDVAVPAGPLWATMVGQNWDATAVSMRAANGYFLSSTVGGSHINPGGWAGGHGPVLALQDNITGLIPDTWAHVSNDININVPNMSLRRSA